MTRRKLKPCPFCGGKAVHKTSWAPAASKVMREVRCRRVVSCGASKQALCPVTQDEAANLWNARAK